MPERHRRHRRTGADRDVERLRDGWLLGIDPEFFMKAVHHLPGWRRLPRQFAEDLVLLIRSREHRIGARLAVVVAQVLIAGKEPHSIANRGAAEARREIAVAGAPIAGLA